MIIDRDKGSVAEWPFDGDTVYFLTPDEIEKSLLVCLDVISILSRHKLLMPNSVRFSQWMQSGDLDVASSVRIDKSEIALELFGIQSFQKAISDCRTLVNTESVYPLGIEITGTGSIVTQSGYTVVNDLVWLRAVTLDIFSISVVTQSDVWLPFGLDGEPQPEMHTLNAERLAVALQEIQFKTQYAYSPGVWSEYAMINGFRLENIRYADGTIADVS